MRQSLNETCIDFSAEVAPSAPALLSSKSMKVIISSSAELNFTFQKIRACSLVTPKNWTISRLKYYAVKSGGFMWEIGQICTKHDSKITLFWTDRDYFSCLHRERVWWAAGASCAHKITVQRMSTWLLIWNLPTSARYFLCNMHELYRPCNMI